MENNNMNLKILAKKIANFSHAYLFKVPSINEYIDDALLFARSIICENYKNNEECQCDKCKEIKNNISDDIYIVNPTTSAILKDDISNLMEYFSSKSLKNEGKRVYIICGFERISEKLSNKILKFLEEPEENVHAILLTENLDKILPTIKSRCQIFKIDGEKEEPNDELYTNANEFFNFIKEKKHKAFAYQNTYFGSIINEREKIDEFLKYMEELINNKIKIENDINEINKLIKYLEITTNIRKKNKLNLNINLLIDRYIIEMSEV